MDRIVGYWVNPTKTDIMNKNISDYTNAGITDLYIGTNREGHTIWGEKATIEEVISKFNHSGIRIHVWMPTFKDADNNWISPKNWSTTKINSVGTLIDIVKDLNKIDGLAGIHFDSIRYPGTAKGDTDSITNFCKAANEAVSDDMILSAAIMGEPSANAYYYGQDAAAMLNAGLNYLTGMIYRCTYGGDQAWMQSVMTAFQEIDTRIIAGVCCYNSDNDATSYDEATLLSDIQAMLDCGSNGVVIFVEHLSNFKGLGDDKVKFTPSEIAEAGLRVYNWIKKNGEMPNYVTINELQITMPQFLYLAAFAGRKVGIGSETAIELIDVAEPDNVNVTFEEGYIETEEIMERAMAIKLNCQKNSIAPTYLKTSLGRVPYDILVFFFSRLMAFIQTYNRMPSKLKVEDPFIDDEEEEDDGTSLITISYTPDMQDNAYQCGPSSMKMALSHYGLTVAESWLATKMGTTSTNGTTVDNMVAVISTVNSTYGTSLKANSETFSSWETLRGYLKSGYPVILRVQSWLNPNGGEHYVLMYGLDIANSKAYLGDPSYGKRTVTLTDLRERIRKVSSNSVIVIKK